MAADAGDDLSKDRCPVCLQPFEDLVYLNNCFHSFCRFCILQWSEFEPAKRHGRNRCPLCRTPFSALLSNYDNLSETYLTSHMMSEQENTHWTQYYDAQNALQAQLDRTQHADGITRRRRALVYAQRLRPLVNFAIPLFPDNLLRGHLLLVTKVTQAFSAKAPLFLARELPLLLLHDLMVPGLTSQTIQGTEIAILTDLIVTEAKTCIVDLVRFVRLCCAYDSNRPPAESADLQPSDLSSVMPESVKSFVTRRLGPFLRENSAIFLRELLLFCLSPWKLEQYESNMEYQDPSEEKSALETEASTVP